MNKVINKKSSERILFEGALFWCAFAISWIFFALNTGNADYRNYENAYNLIGQGHNDEYFELLFLIMVKLANFLGFSYQMFLATVATVTIFLLRSFIRNFTDNVLITYCVFMIYPFMFDIVQYRNFIAYAICLYGLKYLVKEQVNVRDILKYVACVILGSLMHISAIIYIVFLLVLVKSNKNVILISSLFAVALIVLLAFPKLFTELLNMVGLSKYARYDIDNNFSTFIQYFAVYIMFLVLGTLSLNGDYRGKEFKLMFIVLMLVPFVLFNGTAARFFRNTFVLFYAIILNNTPVFVGSKLKVKNLFIVSALLVTVLFVFVMQLGSGLYFETVFKPVIENNLLF